MHSLPSVVIYELYWQILWEVKMLSRKVFVIFQGCSSIKYEMIFMQTLFAELEDDKLVPLDLSWAS